MFSEKHLLLRQTLYISLLESKTFKDVRRKLFLNKRCFQKESVDKLFLF